MAVDVAQREHSNIKCYASTFSSMLACSEYIDVIFGLVNNFQDIITHENVQL